MQIQVSMVEVAEAKCKRHHTVKVQSLRNSHQGNISKVQSSEDSVQSIVGTLLSARYNCEGAVIRKQVYSMLPKADAGSALKAAGAVPFRV